jgi:hypothetical protein
MLEREIHLSFNATFEKTLCISLWTLCLCGDSNFTGLTAALGPSMTRPAEQSAGGAAFI